MSESVEVSDNWEGWNWDYEACVNDPVTGGVWEDVLRAVAVWSVRVDIRASRLETVCKRWKHFWQVAEGVFYIDMKAGRVPCDAARHPYITARQLHLARERMRLQYVTKLFQMGRVNVPRKTLTEKLEHQAEVHKHAWAQPPPPTAQIEEFMPAIAANAEPTQVFITEGQHVNVLWAGP